MIFYSIMRTRVSNIDGCKFRNCGLILCLCIFFTFNMQAQKNDSSISIFGSYSNISRIFDYDNIGHLVDMFILDSKIGGNLNLEILNLSNIAIGLNFGLLTNFINTEFPIKPFIIYKFKNNFDLGISTGYILELIPDYDRNIQADHYYSLSAVINIGNFSFEIGDSILLKTNSNHYGVENGNHYFRIWIGYLIPIRNTKYFKPKY